MSSFTWACFDCRLTVRREVVAKSDTLCPECGSQCVCLGMKLRVPRRRAVAEWRALEVGLRGEQRLNELWAGWEAVRRRHAIERQISELERRETNSERERAINKLRRQLRDA